MTRRELLLLSTGLLPLGCKSKESTPPPSAQAERPVGKKGLCLASKKNSPETIAHFVKSVDARWLYNWNIEPPPLLADAVDYTPMIYRVSPKIDEQLDRVKRLKETRVVKNLLGFNEPDAKTQGNTSVEAALDAWPKLEATGLRLGSPAAVHADNEWMLAFMKGVEERGLRVDFICMHSYGGPSAESLVKKIEKIYQLYRRPIWITEFAVADWKAKSAAENRFKTDRVASFVRELLPKLEAMEFVERYAWFHGGVSAGPLASSQLFLPDGSMTMVGKAYAEGNR